MSGGSEKVTSPVRVNGGEVGGLSKHIMPRPLLCTQRACVPYQIIVHLQRSPVDITLSMILMMTMNYDDCDQ